MEFSYLQLDTDLRSFFFQSEKDYDPFADRRQKTVAEKEDEYRAIRRRMIISPERIDPFAEGRRFIFYSLFESFQITLLIMM